MSLRAKTFLMTSLLMAGMAAGGIGPNELYKPMKEPKAPQYPFTPEELDQLSKLGGKAKKRFLKDLKSKYEKLYLK